MSVGPAGDSQMAASGTSAGSGGALRCLDEALAVLDRPCGGGWLPQFLQLVNALPLPLTDLHGESWLALLPPRLPRRETISTYLASWPLPASHMAQPACLPALPGSLPQILPTSLTPSEEPPNLQPLPHRTRGVSNISNRCPASAPPGQP